MQLGKSLLILAGLLCGGLLGFLFIGWPIKTKSVSYGMTFSRPYAEELSLNPDAVLTTALDTVGIRRFRLNAYWKFIEPVKGEWDFAALDRDITEIGKRGGTVILAIGKKLPRWPECWMPEWVKQRSPTEERADTLAYIEHVITRYRDNKTITAWQIENEPRFVYGECPAFDPNFFQEEVAFARTLDSTRPILTTDSGELSAWLGLGDHVDELGVSVYRVVRNPLFGDINWHWVLPPYFYQRKALLLRSFGLKKIYVSEFQMEPWSHKPLPETPIDDQLTSMNIDQMRSNIAFAEKMGISHVDFWGIEWWIWMKQQGHPEFLEEAIRLWHE